jgi:DNA-binding SARP family transcriptional activator
MLLGGFTLMHGAEEIIIPASAQRLIAFLGLRERPLSRPYVAATLWPNRSAERSLADLRTALWRAKRSLVPVISTLGMRLRLRPEVQVDTHKLAPLGHVTSLIEDRESVRQLRLHAVEGLACEFTMLGRHTEAIHAALTAVKLEPLRETARSALIRAYLAEGNRSEALRQFNHYRQLLSAELGVEPSGLIRNLVRDGVLPA